MEDQEAQVEHYETLLAALRDTIADLMNTTILLRQALVRTRAQLNGHSTPDHPPEITL